MGLLWREASGNGLGLGIPAGRQGEGRLARWDFGFPARSHPDVRAGGPSRERRGVLAVPEPVDRVQLPNDDQDLLGHLPERGTGRHLRPTGLVALGRALGVFIRESTRKQRAGASRNWLATTLAGVAVGFLIAVGYAVGVNLLSIAVSGPPVEAVILLVAGLGAFIGASALQAAVMRK